MVIAAFETRVLCPMLDYLKTINKTRTTHNYSRWPFPRESSKKIYMLGQIWNESAPISANKIQCWTKFKFCFIQAKFSTRQLYSVLCWIFFYFFGWRALIEKQVFFQLDLSSANVGTLTPQLRINLTGRCTRERVWSWGKSEVGVGITLCGLSQRILALLEVIFSATNCIKFAVCEMRDCWYATKQQFEQTFLFELN